MDIDDLLKIDLTIHFEDGTVINFDLAHLEDCIETVTSRYPQWELTMLLSLMEAAQKLGGVTGLYITSVCGPRLVKFSISKGKL